MFSKKEFFVSVGLGLIAGFCIGYSKAREKFAEALVKATGTSEKKEGEGA